MERRNRGLYKAMAVMALLLGVLIIALFNMTVVKGGEYYETGQERSQRKITTVAARGTITDRNGIPLAYDKTCYNVNFYRDPFRTGEKWRAVYTETIIKTIEIVKSYGGSTIDTLYIKQDENGNFYFDWNINVKEDEEGITPEEQEKRLKRKIELTQKRHEMWCGNMGISVKITDAAEAYAAIRQHYMVPDDYTYEQAREVLSIWQEVQYLTYKSYEPVTIARDVDMGTVAEITERSVELDGMAVEEDYIRTYPHGETAAHIVGYMSKQYDEQLDALMAKGYSSDATAGISGIEATMEEYLSSQIGTRAGKKSVEVNSRGKIIRELEDKPAVPGNAVQLTIDYELQRKVDESLAKGIADIREAQEERYKKGNEEEDNYYITREEERAGATREDKKTRFAETGAAIVLDVKTGQVLALSSYPSFDPNAFSMGISQDVFDQYNDEKTTPLFNKAISSKAEPGSIFKMSTAYAALASGTVEWDDEFECKENYEYYSFNQSEELIKKNPKCWIKNDTHGSVNVISGMRASCNIYFYTLAEKTTIENLKKWSDAFGLSSKTNIELTGETTGYVASPEVLYDNEKEINEQKTYKPQLVQQKLKTELKKRIELSLGRNLSEEDCSKAATKIIECIDKNDPVNYELGPDVRKVLREELDIPETVSKGYGLDNYIIQTVLYELKWNYTQTIWTGIGQSVTAVTPISVARYIAAIANGGTVYECNIVKRITDHNGNVVSESNPKVFNTLTDTSIMRYIQLGMNGVTSAEFGGTAEAAFKGFDEITIEDEYGETQTVKDLGAKTGTAQVSKIDLENTAWFVGYTPFEDPEIAVVVYVPNGYAGYRTAPIGREIMDYYREKRNRQVTEEISSPGSILQ